MSGIMDGIQTAKSGLQAYTILQDVAGQNIANASNTSYTRQTADLTNTGEPFGNIGFLGDGVSVSDITRVRDTLLDTQLREASSTTSSYNTQQQWLQKIQASFNEPSTNGINSALTQFWTGWNQLASNPESFASRTSVIANTQNLTTMIQGLSKNLSQFQTDSQTSLNQTVTDINGLTTQLAQLNGDIFKIEAGQKGQANDLRDQRDAALDQLAAKVNINYTTSSNGMVNVFVGGHPAVSGTTSTNLTTQNDTSDASKTDVVWTGGDPLGKISSGELAGAIAVRDTIIPNYQQQLNDFAKTFMDQVNKVYSSGVGTSGQQVIESGLGYSALGAANATAPLNLVPAGAQGSIHLTFYDSSGNAVRSAGIVVDSTDSLGDIANKLNAVPGLNASVVDDSNGNGKLRIQLDKTSGENQLGEASIAMTNPTGGYDSSNFLNTLGFSQTNKSANDPSTPPVLSSVDLTQLQTTLGVGNLTDVLSKPLGLGGSFTINGFETATEQPPKTNGNHVQQFTINVASTDSINDIMGKINALTPQFGVSASVDPTTHQLEITSSAQTDAQGNVVASGGSDYLRLGFANAYQSPAVPNDEPPANYDGTADTTGLLGKLHMNTLIQGTDASNIALDSSITSAEDIHAGASPSTGDNQVALAMTNLQQKAVAGNGLFTIGGIYQNLVANVGTDVSQTQNLYTNENLMLKGFQQAKSSISGVNLDEELGNMITYQRSFDANGKMISTWNQMLQDLEKNIGA